MPRTFQQKSAHLAKLCVSDGSCNSITLNSSPTVEQRNECNDNMHPQITLHHHCCSLEDLGLATSNLKMSCCALNRINCLKLTHEDINRYIPAEEKEEF